MWAQPLATPLNYTILKVLFADRPSVAPPDLPVAVTLTPDLAAVPAATVTTPAAETVTPEVSEA
jgi:hypothetical protein